MWSREIRNGLAGTEEDYVVRGDDGEHVRVNICAPVELYVIGGSWLLAAIVPLLFTIAFSLPQTDDAQQFV